MKIEMICTGEEVLSGQIVDTNAAWFANLLMEQGIEMQRRVTVGDRLADLVATFIERSHHADVIVVNGGLGPTSDDLSAEAMALAKGEALVENSHWRGRIEDWYRRAGRKMNPSNLKQARLPASAIMVDNPVGTACGFRVKLNRAWLFFTPGVPSEFKVMVREQFLPFIHDTFEQLEITRLTKLLTFGVGESQLADALSGLAVPQGITLGYRSSLPHVEIKLFARGERAVAALPDFTEQVKRVIGPAIVSERFPSIAREVHQLLLDRSAHHAVTLSLAESCTGGLVASQLVEYPGSSVYLKQALVAYSNQAKITLLGVQEATLREQGAVSIACVEEMARGVRAQLDTDLGLAVSGIAGPDGGSADTPVGSVALALATREHTWSQMLTIPFQNRTPIRQVSSALALDMLRRALLDQPPLAQYGFIKTRLVTD
ncbi:MAG TPA: damage-inducible protein CinA [Gammaproteobacteria bacterium]|nr:damage-inducible protein CinA [Gammaproteobacteria bacterium]